LLTLDYNFFILPEGHCFHFGQSSGTQRATLVRRPSFATPLPHSSHGDNLEGPRHCWLQQSRCVSAEARALGLTLTRMTVAGIGAQAI
jgi:hypothetical protein